MLPIFKKEGKNIRIYSAGHLFVFWSQYGQANDYQSIKSSTLQAHCPQELKLDHNLLIKIPLNVKIVKQDLLHGKQFLKIL